MVMVGPVSGKVRTAPIVEDIRLREQRLQCAPRHPPDSSVLSLAHRCHRSDAVFSWGSACSPRLASFASVSGSFIVSGNGAPTTVSSLPRARRLSSHSRVACLARRIHWSRGGCWPGDDTMTRMISCFAGKLSRVVPGVIVATPLRLDGSDTAVLVERGFVPTPDAVTIDASALAERGEVQVTGLAERLDSGGGSRWSAGDRRRGRGSTPPRSEIRCPIRFYRSPSGSCRTRRFLHSPAASIRHRSTKAPT